MFREWSLRCVSSLAFLEFEHLQGLTFHHISIKPPEVGIALSSATIEIYTLQVLLSSHEVVDYI